MPFLRSLELLRGISIKMSPPSRGLEALCRSDADMIGKMPAATAVIGNYLWQPVVYSARKEASADSNRRAESMSRVLTFKRNRCAPAGRSSATSLLPPTALPSTQALGLDVPVRLSFTVPAFAVWKRAAAQKASLLSST